MNGGNKWVFGLMENIWEPGIQSHEVGEKWRCMAWNSISCV